MIPVAVLVSIILTVAVVATVKVARTDAAKPTLGEVRRRLEALDARLDDDRRTIQTDHARRVIDEIGLEVGVAPAATVVLGEHLLADAAVITVGEPDADGWHSCTIRVDVAGGTWFDDTGIDRHAALADIEPVECTVRLQGHVELGQRVQVPFVPDEPDDDHSVSLRLPSEFGMRLAPGGAIDTLYVAPRPASDT